MDAQEGATHIVKTLVDAGYVAYFAGGWVRDVILHHPSGDIDIATNAPPEKIMEIFPKTVPVGISFGVVMVILDGIEFEVSTFRKDFGYKDGRKPEKIEYSDPKEDALRRDFTINGMFYNPLTMEVHDYVGGMEDLKKGVVRTIGDPRERFTEDRLRMIRAVRFGCRFEYDIEDATKKAIKENANTLLPAVSMERVWQEFVKMREYPAFDQACVVLHELELMPVIFPALKEVSLEEIKKRVQWFSHFPEKTPTILFIMELFPGISLEERLEVCRYLRVSNQEQKIVHYFAEGKALFEKKDVEKAEWAEFYADPRSELFLEMEGARLSQQEHLDFLHFHEKQQVALFSHVERIRQNLPLVNSSMLMLLDVKPGPIMGQLLEEAKRISINEDVHDADTVMKKLIQSPLWPYKK